jgi:hypothetical protein
VEVQEAVKRGYKLLEMHEVWHYKHRIKYDPESKTGGLFTNYINAMLKIKQEASGFPESVKSDEQKHAYITEYYEKEGNSNIRLMNFM